MKMWHGKGKDGAWISALPCSGAPGVRWRPHPKRAGPMAAFIGIAAALLSACGSSPAASHAGTSSASSGKGAIVIGYENNGADPSMVTIGKGYFQKELGPGVSLKLFTSGPAALGAIASGSLQFMCGLGVPPMLSPIAKGVPLAVVWNQERYTTDAGIVVKASSGITSLKGLEGKTIAITTGSEASFELPTLLQQAGVPLSAVHQLNMSPPEMRSAWATGQISAAIVWDPVFDYLASHGGRVLATDASLPLTASSYNICVASKSYLQANSATAARFVQAMQDGVAYSDSHPAQALALMESEAGISAATAQKELKGYQIYDLAEQPTPQVLGSGPGVASADTTQSLVSNWKQLYKQGFLTAAPPSDMAAYVDPVPAETALKGAK